MPFYSGICVQIHLCQTPRLLYPHSRMYNRAWLFYISKYPHPRPPTIVFGINHNLVGKRVCFAGRYWGNVILLPVYRRDNLHSSFQQHRLHSFSNLSSLCGGASASHLSTQHGHIPLSVLGVASVTSSVHCSQHTSSSPFINPQAFRRFFSKN